MSLWFPAAGVPWHGLTPHLCCPPRGCMDVQGLSVGMSGSRSMEEAHKWRKWFVSCCQNGTSGFSVCGYLFMQRRKSLLCFESLSWVSGTYGHSNRSLNTTHKWTFLNISKCAKSPEQPSISLCGQDLDFPCPAEGSDHWLQSSALGKWSLQTKSCFITVECQKLLCSLGW